MRSVPFNSGISRSALVQSRDFFRFTVKNLVAYAPSWWLTLSPASVNNEGIEKESADARLLVPILKDLMKPIAICYKKGQERQCYLGIMTS